MTLTKAYMMLNSQYWSTALVSWKAGALKAVGEGIAIADKALLLQGSPEGDTITVHPSKIDPHCEALMFVLSASDSDVSTMNLNNPDTLQYSYIYVATGAT